MARNTKENPANVVKTERDERLWSTAKSQVRREYPSVKVGSDRYWALVNGIFQRMKNRTGGTLLRGNPVEENPATKKHSSSFKRGRMPTREEEQDLAAKWFQLWLVSHGMPNQIEVASNIKDIIKNRGVLPEQEDYGQLLLSLSSYGRFYDWIHWYLIEPRKFPMYFPRENQTVTVKDIENASLQTLDSLYKGQDIPYVPRPSDNSRGPIHGNPVEFSYERFHGVVPDTFTEKEMWVPGGLVEIGRGVDVGYGITDRRSVKDGWFIHDFNHGVHIYRRARDNEEPTIVFDDFPAELWALGFNLGFTYEDADGKKHEVKESKTKKLATNETGDILVVVGPKGVEYVLRGGAMHVTDWIRN